MISTRPFANEKAFQAATIELARAFRWRHFHPHDSRRSVAGWPDLVLVRDGALMFRELKTERGRLTADQRDWLSALQVAGQDVGVWRPADWLNGTIEAELR